MCHTTDPDECLEILGNKLRAIIRYDPGECIWELLPGSLNNCLNVSFGHALADFTVHYKPAVPVQNSTQIVKGSANIYIANIYMPVFMRLCRLIKTCAFLRGFSIPLL